MTQKRCLLAIDASLKTLQEIPPSDDYLSSSLKYELNIAEHTGQRGNLLILRRNICNKFRSRLSDTTLNTLCLIRKNKK